MICEKCIGKLPKSDLHLHLDGSLRLSTLIDLAKKYKINLPSYEEAGMRELVFKEQYSSLVDYLNSFRYTTAVMRTEEALERISYELAQDNMEEGVRYIEVRFAPQLHIHSNLNIYDILKSVNRGLKKAQYEFNSQEKIKEGLEPPFHYGIIVCALRMFEEGYSEYYDNFLKVHQHSPKRKIFGLASLELAQAAVKIRDELGIPIVGFDLAGAENGYPPSDHIQAYQYVHKNFMKKTVHAGEAYGAESIFQAITDLYADRIGHGYYIFNEDMITDKNITDKNKYIQALSQYIADRRITLEICLTSNMQTIPDIKDISNHTFKKMQEAKLSTTIATDNRLMSNTTVTKELNLAIKYLNLDEKTLKNIIIYGFKRSFFPGTYLEKRKYVRQVINYYEKIEKECSETCGNCV